MLFILFVYFLTEFAIYRFTCCHFGAQEGYKILVVFHCMHLGVFQEILSFWTQFILQPYDTIRDTIRALDRKPTWVSLIYRTKPTTKKCKNRKTKSSKQICSEITVNSLGNPCSESWRRNAAVGMICRKGFKPGMKEWVGDGIPSNSKYDCW